MRENVIERSGDDGFILSLLLTKDNGMKYRRRSNDTVLRGTMIGASAKELNTKNGEDTQFLQININILHPSMSEVE